MITDIQVGERIYVINQYGKYLRTIGWVGRNKVEWKWGWTNVEQIIQNPDTSSRVKYVVFQK